MRLKKQKRHRKVVRFYSACFGFREPYKVPCDDTFIRRLLVHGLTPADDSLSSLLGTRVLFTTRCMIQVLKSLGESHVEALVAVHQLMPATYITSAVAIHFYVPDIRHLLIRVFTVYSVLILIRCNHEKRVDAETCVQSI